MSDPEAPLPPYNWEAALIAEARDCVSKGDLTSALEHWKKALRRPAQRHVQLLGEIADALKQLDRADLALALWEDVTARMREGHLDLLACFAWKQLSLRFPMLLEPYLRAASLFGSKGGAQVSDRAWLQKAWERFHSAGRNADATALKAAAPFATEDVVAAEVKRAVDAAWRARQNGRLQEAEAHCQRALAGDGESDAALAELRELYLETGRLVEAHQLSLRLVQIHERRGDSKSRAEEIARAATTDPSRATAWYDHGRDCEERGRLDQAMHAYRAALEREPSWEGAHRALSEAAWWAGDRATAEEAAKQLMRSYGRIAALRETLDADLCAPQGRLLRFPADPAGSLWGKPPAGGRWRNLGAAVGKVWVPPGVALRLVIAEGEDAVPDLSFLTGFEPGALEQLSLEGVALDEAALAPLAALSELRWLSFSGAGLAALGGLSHPELLSGLDLEQVGELIRSHGPDHHGMRVLRHLPLLEHLDLSMGATENATLFHLADMRRIRVLRLGATSVSDDGLSQLRPLEALRDLDLSSTAVTAEGLASLTPLPFLRALDLSSLDLSAAGLDALASLPRLARVDLSRTHFDIEVLPSLRRVEFLQLGPLASGVGAAELDILARMPSLRVLALPGMKAAPGDIERFTSSVGRPVTLWLDRELDVLTGRVSCWVGSSSR